MSAASAGAAWRQLTVLTVVGFCTYSAVYSLLPVLPLYLAGRGLSTALVGVVIGLMNGVSFLVRPLAALLSERWGRAGVLRLACGLLAASSLALAAVPSALGVALTRLLAGFGWGGYGGTANTIAAAIAPARRGLMVGVYTTSGSVALVAMPSLGLELYRHTGLEVLAALSGLLAIAAGLAALAVAGPPRLPRPTQPPALAWRETMLSGAALRPALVLGLFAMTYGGVIAFVPLLTGDAHAVESFFVAYALGLIVARSLAGRVSDRVGRRATIIPGLLAGALALSVLATSADQGWTLPGAGLAFAAAMAMVQPASLAWGADLAGPRTAAAMATMVMAQDAGIAGGSALLGLVAAAGGVPAVFAAGAAVCVLAAALLVTRPPRAPLAPTFEAPA